MFYAFSWRINDILARKLSVNSTFTRRRSACEIEWLYIGGPRSISGLLPAIAAGGSLDDRRFSKVIFLWWSTSLPPPLSPSCRATIRVERSLIQRKMRSRIIRRSRITDEQRSRPSNIISVFEYKTWRADAMCRWNEMSEQICSDSMSGVCYFLARYVRWQNL